MTVEKNNQIELVGRFNVWSEQYIYININSFCLLTENVL